MELSSLDEHCTDVPAPENAFALFGEDWEYFKLKSTESGRKLFEVLPRGIVRFCDEQIGGFSGKTVLELGPYEGYHTAVMARAGAKSVAAIEANPNNFLKCLIVGNHFRLKNVRFLLGDFSRFFDSNEERFDFVLASGVLYHLTEPLDVLWQLTKITDSIGICTTYYDELNQLFKFTGRKRLVTFDDSEPFVLHQRMNPVEVRGKKHGIQPDAWMFSLDDLLRFLEFCNFDVVMRDRPEDPTRHVGPRVQLFARRRK
ncbi:MAG: class I SAM-dependent methyltransferase [Planctomycetota bacterium]